MTAESATKPTPARYDQWLPPLDSGSITLRGNHANNPSIINQQGIIHCSPKIFLGRRFQYQGLDYEPISYGDVTTILLTTHDLSIDIPSVDLTQGEINHLEESKRKVLSDAHAKVQMIEGKIQSLRCIEHK